MQPLTEVRSVIIVAALLVVGSASCREEPAAAPVAASVVFSLDGDPVSFDDFEQYVQKRTGESSVDLDARGLHALFERFIDQESLRRMAIERGMVTSAADHTAAISALLERSELSLPDDQAVEAYYVANLASFERDDRVRLIQYLYEDRGEAQAARRALLAGDQPNPPGQDLGELTDEDLLPELVPVIAGLAPGEISQVIEADYGYSVFHVIQRLPKETLALERVADQIRDRLLSRSRSELLEQLTSEAREQYNVTVYEQNLPFPFIASSAR